MGHPTHSLGHYTCCCVQSFLPLVLRLTTTPSDFWVRVAGVEGPGFLLPAYTLTTHRYTPESRGRAENSLREYRPSFTFSIAPPIDRLRSSPQLTTPSGLIRATSTWEDNDTIFICNLGVWLNWRWSKCAVVQEINHSPELVSLITFNHMECRSIL